MQSSSQRGRRVRAGVLVLLCAAAAGGGNAGTQAQQESELVIRNGLIATVEGRMQADVRVRGGTIVEIGGNLTVPAGARQIDARGKILVPGGVDPHVHLTAELPATPRPNATVDDYTSGSAAALAGGVTTIANFVTRRADEGVPAFIERVTAEVNKAAMADFILHVNLGNDPGWATPGNLELLAKAGLVSTKTFMRQPAFDANPLGYMKAFRASGEAGILSMIHCEDAAMLTELTQSMMAAGKGSLHNYPAARSVITEVAATERAVSIAEFTGAPIYIVHLSAGRALDAAVDGMKRGLPIYVETRPLYLHFTEEVYLRPDVGLFIGEPPMRETRDVEALWAGIGKGTVHVVSTDHSGYPKATKLDPAQTIADKRAGMNLLQAYRPVLFSEGVVKGRITLEQFIEASSTNPAKLFGIYPRKGTIRVGSDADIVIWDPTLKRQVRDADELSNARYTIFNGWEVTGWPVATIRRGEVVYENGKIVARAGSGRFVPGARFSRPVLRTSTSYSY
jgi:dihydropyrimidinase